MFVPMVADVIEGDRGGLFAGKHFNTLDTVVCWRFGGTMDPSGVFSKMRHSCDPSCGMILRADAWAIISIRPINTLQELTFDLSSWREDQEEMPCSCKSPLCRKIIQDFDELPPHLQHRYLRLKVVAPQFIERFRPRE